MTSTQPSIPGKMQAVVTARYGGPKELLFVDDYPVPQPGDDDVLVRVSAAGVNPVDIAIRENGAHGNDLKLIQGSDIVGQIVDVGTNVSRTRIGQRVLLEGWVREGDPDNPKSYGYLGMDRNGGFAQFVKAPEINAFSIETSLTDTELASFPVAYSTAENMLTRASVTSDDRVLVTGASGSVGLALVQLAKVRGATVIGIASESKKSLIMDAGVDVFVPRSETGNVKEIRKLIGDQPITVVADTVIGAWANIGVELLAGFGRYVTCGAIDSALVNFNFRPVWAKDLQILGATKMDRTIFPRLVKLIEDGQLKPFIHRQFPLEELEQAQECYKSPDAQGKIVVLP